MKIKKSLLILFITMFVFISRAYADEDTMACYYKSDDLRAQMIYQKGGIKYASIRVYSHGGDAKHRTGTLDQTMDVLQKNYDDTCPKYMVSTKNGFNRNITVTDSLMFAQTLANNSKSTFYAGSVSANAFWGLDTCVTDDCILGNKVNITCENNELFGDPRNAGGTYTDSNGNEVEVPPSLAYLINKILGYVRILVPILIIVLGMIDLGRAVIASKEDEMKKAQLTLFKRIIAGVCVFLVPILVNVVMQVADIAWDGQDYESCRMEIMLNK